MSINPISTDLTQTFSESVRAARTAQPSAPGASARESARPGLPSFPPREVFAAMVTAAQAADRLTAAGRALHFSTNDSTGLSVQLTDLDGTVLRTVAPSAVLNVASGDILD
jgi:hypothetical protein